MGGLGTQPAERDEHQAEHVAGDAAAAIAPILAAHELAANAVRHAATASTAMGVEMRIARSTPPVETGGYRIPRMWLGECA